MAKPPRDVQRALQGLTETRNSILRLGIPEGAKREGFAWTDEQAATLNDVYSIGKCIEDLSSQIVDTMPDGEKARALLNLDVLLLTLEKLFRVDLAEDEIKAEARALLNARLERTRSFIDRTPASFYDGVVADVYREHVEANGPWSGRSSKLAAALKPEVDRRAKAGGGKALEVDTITRRIKVLAAPARH